jgi:glycosyltransferase involved in cell wall biosynthesis
MAGDGAHAQRVREKIRALNLDNYVELPGYIEGERLWQLYNTADVFVLPTFHPEGFPTVITEAMSVGLPVVTTRIRGVVDHLQEGTNVLFVSPKDPVSLAKAVVTLLKDPVLRSCMGKANQEKIKDFSPDKAGKLYLEVLQDMLQSALTSS